MESLFPAGKIQLDAAFGVVAKNKRFVRHYRKAREYPSRTFQALVGDFGLVKIGGAPEAGFTEHEDRGRAGWLWHHAVMTNGA